MFNRFQLKGEGLIMQASIQNYQYIRKLSEQPMEIIEEKYSFNPKQPLGGLYEDAEIKNVSYRAVRNQDGKQVQLVIYKSIKPGQIASYYKKISKFAEVYHPNLTPIIECTQDSSNNLLFVVLEWAEGYSLKEFLSGNVLNWKTAYSIIKDILMGLNEIHKQGLVYSFINLENIEICAGKARLSFRYLIYKTYYLAPEVKQNHQKTPESDLFSIGVCLFRIVFGTLPFKTKTLAQFVKSVKNGVARKQPIQNACYQRLIPKELQQYLNLLCHLVPKERQKYAEIQKQLDEIVKRVDSSLMPPVLDEKYILLSLQMATDEYVSASVIDLSKLKHKQQKRIFNLEMIKHNLTEISTYVDDIIIPFKNAANVHFANIHEFYVAQKDCLVIIYDYCSQGSLKDYNTLAAFNKEMAEQVSSILRNLLSQWRGQYRFLTNELILINNGRPVLKYPPFPTNDLKAKLKLSKKANYFIAPQIEGGIQSLTADSWSVGAIEYWMRFGSMPEFDEKGGLMINDRSQLTAEKCTQLAQLLCRKHRERKNLFPIQNKPTDRKISSDSYSSNESPRLSSRIKSVPSAQNAIRMTLVTEDDEKQEDIQQFSILSPHYAQNQQEPKTRKKVRSGANINNKSNPIQDQYQDNIEQMEPSLKIKNLNQLRKKRIRKKQEQTIEKPQQDIVNKASAKSIKDSPQIDIFSSQLNLLEKTEATPKDKPLLKRFPTFSGAKDEKKSNNRDSIQKERDRESTKYKKDSQYQRSQNSRRKTLQSALGVEPMDMDNKLISGLVKEGWRMSLIDRHWSKPIRVFIKGVIALIMYIFMFYLTFLSINGSLMKSRYDYSTQTLNLRSDSLATTATINFTAVTRTPLETYNSLNNQTLTFIRDVEKCVTNDYNNNSNVYKIISSGSFGTYQAFGFIIVILNLILLSFSLAKFDLPKALSMTQFDQHSYAPLYNWLLVNLALTSLTSCTYLNYGGLFDLQLDPCLSRSSFPSLTYLMKNESSSFVWRFVWVYIGILIAYILIIYLIINPKVSMPRYAYICLILLYLGGVGVRALGTYNTSLCSIFGACGQLLSVLIGLPLMIIDVIASCRLRKIEKSSKEGGEMERNDELEVTESNFNV